MTLSLRTKVLHILIGFSMITLLAVGIYMHETETFALYPLHKSFGVIVLVFALYRVVIRAKEGWPEPLGNSTPAWQLLAAKAVHWCLIISTLVYPLSGMMMSAGGGHGIAVFGLELFASNYDAVTGKAVPINESLASLGHAIHGLLYWVLIPIIVLHVAGALKHHFVEKDDTIKRMFSFKSS